MKSELITRINLIEKNVYIFDHLFVYLHKFFIATYVVLKQTDSEIVLIM